MQKAEFVIDQTGVKCYYDRHGKKHIIKKNAENKSKNVEAVQICNRTSQNPINVRKTLDSPIPVNLKTVYAYNLIQNTQQKYALTVVLDTNALLDYLAEFVEIMKKGIFKFVVPTMVTHELTNLACNGRKLKPGDILLFHFVLLKVYFHRFPNKLMMTTNPVGVQVVMMT